ncbi:MAG: hypothetical protein MJZ67_06130 [Bacteroidales bacterium]|nr:hypothetical protein [Bacteroidales bacterium]
MDKFLHNNSAKVQKKIKLTKSNSQLPIFQPPIAVILHPCAIASQHQSSILYHSTPNSFKSPAMGLLKQAKTRKSIRYLDFWNKRSFAFLDILSCRFMPIKI